MKKSTSDLLMANCDEFILYDDLVRERAKKQGRKKKVAAPETDTLGPFGISRVITFTVAPNAPGP